MPNVDFVIFRTASNKVLVDSSKARVDNKITLRKTFVRAHNVFMIEIPKMNALRLKVDKSKITTCI